MFDNVSSNKKFPNNITTNGTRLKGIEIQMKEILDKIAQHSLTMLLQTKNSTTV